jgi:nicotinamidase-related amidase
VNLAGTSGILVDLAFVACGIALLVLLVQQFRRVTGRQEAARRAEAGPGVALVVVDLPLESAAAQPFSPVIANAAGLAAEFRERGLTVVLSSTVAGGPAAVRIAQSGDLVVATPLASAFAVADLDPVLRGRGISRLVLAGTAAGSRIETTARHAYDLGYRVVIARDAVDESFAERAVRGYAELSTTRDVVASLLDLSAG